MGQVIVIEILDKSGRVQSRTRHDRFPIRIGRAYGSDLIVDDEFVSPEHVVIDLGADNTLVATDLNSSNGLYLNAATEKISYATLGEDNLLRIGQTSLRVRTPEFRVPAAIKDCAESRLTQRLVSNHWGLMLAFPITAAILVWSVFWETYTEIKLPALLLPPTLIMAMLLAWAGIWALASRLYAHHSSYFVHAIIACVVFIGVLILDILLTYYAFAFSADLSGEILTYLGFTGLATLLLYWHLRTFVQHRPKYLAMAAGLVACTLASVIWLSIHAAGTRDTGRLHYNATLKPLAFKVAKTLSTEAFAGKAAALKHAADEAVREAER